MSTTMTTEEIPEIPHDGYYQQLKDLATSRHWFAKYVPPLLLLADAALTALVIWKVNYTEIDWTAYMEQIEQVIAGERDYTKIKGGTGPLVYPAAHVYIYWGLYKITDGGRDIFLAQCVFAVLYLATVGLAMRCYKNAKAPLYIFPMLILSKRLHSIFVLRLFNDGFAAFFLWLSIFLYQKRLWTFGSIAYSLGVGVKMSLLLGLPAVACVLFLGRGVHGAFSNASMMAQVQIALAIRFLQGNFRGYLNRAFELSRQFLFKWTVNWRFVGEETFLSKPFSLALLAGHISVLIFFIGRRWLRPTEMRLGQLLDNILQFQEPTGKLQGAVSHRVSPNFILTIILSANAIGMLFARSLHYQFYTYIALATPFLLWRAGLHPIAQYGIWAAQEWAWNVYPSTSLSSAVVVGALLVQVVSIWWGTRTDYWEPKGHGCATTAAKKTT